MSWRNQRDSGDDDCTNDEHDRLLDNRASDPRESDSTMIGHSRQEPEELALEDRLQTSFSAFGVEVSLQGVTLVEEYCLGRCCCFKQKGEPRVCFQVASALFTREKLHVVSDVDGIAGKALVRAIKGLTDFSGNIEVDRMSVKESSVRANVGVVSGTETVLSRISVAANLRLVLDMRTRATSQWKSATVAAAAAFVGLDVAKQAGELTAGERMQLCLGMELLLDTPVLIALYPFEGLDFSTTVRCATILKRVAAVLHKTVIVFTSRSLPPRLFEHSATTLLFGALGHVLFSGPSSKMLGYFNGLCIPQYCEPSHAIPETDSPLHSHSHYADGVSEVSRNCSASSLHRSSSRTPCHRAGTQSESSTPALSPRLSSRLLFNEDHTAMVTDTNREGGGRFVSLTTAEDAMDLAIEWSESEVQTLYYAAKYYDSSIGARVANLAIEGTWGGAPSQAVPHEAPPPQQRVMAKPFILLGYCAKQYFLNADFAVGLVGVLIGLTVVSLLMQSQPEDQGGMYNIRGILFTTFALALIVNESAISTTALQMRLLIHQRNSGLYSTWCLMLCLIVCTVLARLGYLAVFIPFILLIMHASALLIITVGCVCITHAFFLHMFATVLPSPRVVAFACRGYFAYTLMCSGFLFNLRSMPQHVGDLSVVRWGYGPALKERLDGKPFSCDGVGNTSYCYTGSEYLHMEGLQNDSYHQSLLILCLLSGCALFVMGTYLSLAA